tara:strand:+ start:466 stop:615 length:150 start_codon:yes stop_codon:yes gene_type:complete
MALTNWVFQNFNLVQENAANLLLENGIIIIALQESNPTVWVEKTETGTG